MSTPVPDPTSITRLDAPNPGTALTNSLNRCCISGARGLVNSCTTLSKVSRCSAACCAADEGGDDDGGDVDAHAGRHDDLLLQCLLLQWWWNWVANELVCIAVGVFWGTVWGLCTMPCGVHLCIVSRWPLQYHSIRRGGDVAVNNMGMHPAGWWKHQLQAVKFDQLLCFRIFSQPRSLENVSVSYHIEYNGE